MLGGRGGLRRGKLGIFDETYSLAADVLLPLEEGARGRVSKL